VTGKRPHDDTPRRGQFTDEQIAFALKQAELGVSVEDVCRKMGI
jgi:putative transposase